MEAVREIYESSPDFIAIPPAFRRRRVEVIILPLEDAEITKLTTSEEVVEPFSSVPDFPVKTADPGILEFAGCMPDFPSRAPQGPK